MNRIEKKAWEGTTLLAAACAGLAARQLLKLAWRETQGEEPPENPAAAGVTWADALGWAVASGVAMGLARVLSRRGTTAAFRAITENDPASV